MQNFLFLFFLTISGLFLFKEGFLLTRLELENRAISPSSPPISSPPRFKKTLLVMIDALRYDFMKWDESWNGKRDIPHYLNKLSVIKTVLEREPQNALLLRGLSDPPTTTLQRLMAIMTGALPTLVDAGSNFASSALKEDNLIEKILASGKRVVSLGDDTWDRLFPSSINESYFYPSFDVWDLHSVDLGVLEHLMPMLDAKEHDWGLLIAHFLGVDHAGHRYGPGHVAMGDKLVQMNQVLGEIFEKSHPDTLVIVMGDHGMDKKGDHGGDSPQEMNAGLFFYSKTPFLTPGHTKDLKSALDNVLNLDPDYNAFTVMDGDRTVQQIDLVPTLASLMGLSIPFGNLGSVIPEFFLGLEGYSSLLNEIAKNAKQISDYLDVYTLQRSDANAAFAGSRALYKDALKAHQHLLESTKPSRDDEMKVFLEYTKFMRQTLLVARAIWSRFEHSLMAMGSVTLILTLIVSLRMFTYDRLESRDWKRCAGALVGGGVFGMFSPIRRVVYPNVVDVATITLQTTHEILFFAVVGLMISWLVFSKKGGDPLGGIKTASDGKSVDSYLLFRVSTVLILLYACTLGSDSFLIFEDFVLLHFCQLIHLLLFTEQYLLAQKNGFKSVKGMLKMAYCLIATRAISLVTICRPDQGPYCVPTYNDTPTSSISALWTLAPSAGLCLLACYYVFTHNSILYSVLFTVNVVNVQAYWMIETLDNHFIPLYPVLLDWKNGIAHVYWILLVPMLFSGGTVLDTGFVLMIMFQKPMGCIVLALFYFYLKCMRDHATTTGPQLCFMMGWLVFFATGHQNILATIQHDVGFIGLVNADMTLSPIFIALNTFGGPLLGTLGLVTFPAQYFGMVVKSHGIIWTRHLAFCVFFTWYFCRHSQAFRVWGPKFIFFAAGHVLCGFAFLIGLFVTNRQEQNRKIKIA